MLRMASVSALITATSTDELFADQAARVLDALLAVERVADRQRVDDRALGPHRCGH